MPSSTSRSTLTPPTPTVMAASNGQPAPPAAAAMVTTAPIRPTSFYRRDLKPPCVAFSSVDGRALFREALVDGTMENYFRLAEQFRTQDEVAFCGLSTLTMVLNALAVDPGRVWKGPWRWYHESMLDCCASLETVKNKGITLSTLACLARCNGLTVSVSSPDTHTIEDLRAVIEECASEDIGKVVVVSYDRRGLKQTGTGHFSPIGGFHRGLDLVLIMDTARFKLPPHWAPLSMLWEAMKTLDPETGKPRGFLVMEKAHSLSHRLFTANAQSYKDWPKVASWINEIVELATRSPGEDEQENGDREEADEDEGLCESDKVKRLRGAATISEFVPPLLALLPAAVKGLLTTFNAPESTPGKVQDGVVLQAIQGTEVYLEVTRMERCGWGSGAGAGGREVPHTTYSSPSTSPSNSASSFCPKETACGCSSRHVVSIVTYALLVLLHKRDDHGEGASGASAEGGDGDRDDAAEPRNPGPEPAWRKDPLRSLPPAVAGEAKHVAGMLAGLAEMGECEKCARR